jgi:hypothetical protein
MSPSSIAGRSSAASQSAAAAAAISPASRACQCGTGLGECSNPLGDEWGNNVSNGGVWKEGAVRRRGECSGAGGAGGAGAEIREGKGRAAACAGGDDASCTEPGPVGRLQWTRTGG